mgnify:CR=1 FL=1
MIKIRLQLLAIVAVFGCSAWMITGASWDMGAKVISFGICLVFVVSAVTLLLITLFGLDERGRIVKGSLAYWLINFISANEEPLEDKIRLCPAFWRVVFVTCVLAGLAFILSAGVAGAYRLSMGLYSGVIQSDFAKADWGAIGVGVVPVIVAFLFLFGMEYYVKAYGKTWKQWVKNLSFFLTIYVFVWIFILLFSFINFLSLAVSEVVLWSLLYTGGVLMGFSLVLGVIVGVVAGLIALAKYFHAYFKGTLFGEMLRSLYDKVCVEIPIVSSKT